MVDADDSPIIVAAEEQQHPAEQTVARREIGDGLGLRKVVVDTRGNLPAFVELLARQDAEVADDERGFAEERWR